ncbi:MAG: 2Fe-2S iron-sulfur cluster-binding protein, partial [Dehalococcoidia bacterium]|nr:2Fe-2S iron-sulfur cluster-binding protein [Dehalococcoidia bacterium]
MQQIDKEEYQKRIDQITELFTSIIDHADEQSTYRCPYKNKEDRCTAKFGCRNQRKPDNRKERLICGGDYKLDYRQAWETEEVEGGMAIDDENTEHSMGTVASDDRTRNLSVGKTIFDYADELEIQLPTSCLRTGQCHECIVEIKQGMEALQPRNEAESFLQDNYRLACQAVVSNADIDIDFSPLRRKPQILTNSNQTPIIHIDPIVTCQSGVVYYDRESIDKYRGHLYGLAIDLGTTTVVISLVDLENGKSITTSAFENPQRFGGS